MMTDEELKETLREAVSAPIEADIAHVVSPHAFSERFERKMETLFAYGVSKKKQSVKGKRRLIIAAAAVLILSAAACSVPKIRESVAGFFIQVFQNHAEYINPSITKTRIEEKYGLVPIPEGFSVVRIESTDTDLITTYLGKENNIFLLYQIAGNSIQAKIDWQNGSFKEYCIGEKTVRVYYSESSAQASWIENGYLFSITYPAHIELSIFEDIINAVQLIED